jgi:cholesterol transport system auxiliary component
VKRSLAAVALSLAMAGCAGGLLGTHGEAPQVYRIAGAPAQSGGPSLPVALAVARPRAASSLDTERIAVVRGGSGFDYFAGMRWSDPAPQMLQQVLVEALVVDGRFATAVAAPSRVPAEFLLDVELREFAAFYETADTLPQARVRWQATLIDARSGTRVASFQVGSTAVAVANRRDALIVAFQQATQAAVSETVARIRAGSESLGR